MLICAECRKEMTVIKNGYGIRYGKAHVYEGDLYRCNNCRTKVIRTISVPIHDPDHKVPSLQMKDEE